MKIHYENLDEKTREFMLRELEMDVEQGKAYISQRLNSLGQSKWVNLLKEAIKSHDDNWLANQLRTKEYMGSREEKTRNGKTTTAKVPKNAPETLSEGEFNHYYARGICARALAEGTNEVIVYRAKEVRQPRPESQSKIGQRIDAKKLLKDLRTSHGTKPALGIPSGPNSGLTVRLP